MSNPKQSCRVLLEKEQATRVGDLVIKLRNDYCKVDSSKLVNQIVATFFHKYAEQEHSAIVTKFFDKRSYLRNMINTTPLEEIDVSIKSYLGKRMATKVCKPRLKKNVPVSTTPDSES